MELRLAAGSFYGNMQKSQSIGGLLLSEHAYPADLNIPSHSHERAYFCLVLRGGYTESYGRRTRDCQAASLIFHPEAEVHSDRFSTVGGHLFCVELTPPWLERIRVYSPVLDQAADMQGGAPACLAFRFYREFRNMDSVSPLAMEGLALEILAEASRRAHALASCKTSRPLLRAQEMLHAQFAENLTLSQIAEAVGVHPMHLARLFRQRCRCTLGEYVRQLRVDYACRELVASDASLVEIALAAGFSDQSQFCKMFKRHTGLTPLQFRQIAPER
jgi:AraC family transcriptional regulator